MNTIRISLMAVLLMPILSLAQTPSLIWSPAHTKPSMQIDVNIYPDAEGGYYIINKRPPSKMEFSPGIHVEYFNSSFDRKFAKDLQIQQIEDFVGVYFLNNKLYLVKALFSKDAGANTLSAYPVMQDGSLGKAISIASMPAGKLAARGLFAAAISPDGKKMLVLSQPDFVKDENERITITVLNSNLEKEWSASPTFAYPWTRAVYNEPFVNNQGTAFILKKTDMKGEGNTYSLFSCKGKELKEFKLDMDGKKKAATLAKAISPEGDLAIAGYYTEEAKVRVSMGTAYQGCFLWRMDAGGERMKVSSVIPFEKRKDILARRIHFFNDITILAAEEYHIMDKATDNAERKAKDPFARDYTYYGEEIFIDGIDGSGKLVYSSMIKKDNNSTNDNGTWVSFFSEMVNGKLAVIFIDDKYRYDEKKKWIILGGGSKIMVMAMVDPLQGAVIPAEPMDNSGPVGGKDGDMLLRPDVFARTGTKSFIMRAENTRIYRIGKMNF